MDLKKIKDGLVAIFLLLFSFYYTNKAIELVQNVDPIMKQIKTSASKYEIDYQNAQIIGNKIIPGINGLEIDYEESYTKMKQYGSYNEALTTFEETRPTVSIDNNFDKYIVKGNTKDKSVALVFKVLNIDEALKISNLLNTKKIKATFFIDGNVLEKNVEKVLKIKDIELELLSYNGKYEKSFFESAKNYLETLTKRKSKYCYTDYSNKEVLDLCASLKMHTIMPTLKIEKHLYAEVKNNLSNSIIIATGTNVDLEELALVIDYVNKRGYQFLYLETLLSEKIEK